MADDRMKNDEQRNMGAGGRDDQDWKQGQQTPGRNPQGGQQVGGQQGQQGGQRKDNLNMEDDEEMGGGQSGQRGGQGQGGQGRGGQNR
jgi:hypothetical protein